MWILRKALPVFASFAVVFLVTTVLWYVKFTSVHPQHLVFFYLLPTAFVAILFGNLPAMLCALAAAVSAAFFLYNPIYSFYVSDTRELGELICFVGLGLIGAKCMAELLRPVAKVAQSKSRYGRP